MAFTFSQARKLSPEEASPMQALISRAMETFGKGLDLSYKPRQKEADIFSKEIGPLASLATSPNFQGFSPQVQKMISQRIGNYLGGQGSQQSDESGQYDTDVPGYASGQDILDRSTAATDITEAPGGHGNVARSNIAGAITKVIGDNALSKWLNSGDAENAAAEEAKGDAADAEARRFLRLHNFTPQEIETKLRKRPGETPAQRKERLRPDFVAAAQNDNNQSNSSTGSSQKIPRKLALMPSDDLLALYKSMK